MPEGTIIRIKATKNITSVITESYAKLYFYNEEDGSYELVQTNISKDSEGYYNLKIKNANPLLIYGVETSLQMYIAEMSESLRELYVVGCSLPTTSEYIYLSMTKKL